jgi:(E)-4-hydroxy-3-methylbut-2-enyl-diphosphate synthase
MGCVVNGPGEAREADIGLAGGSPNLLYIGGKPDHKVDEAHLLDELERVVRAEVKRRQENPQALHHIPIVQQK